MASLSSQAPAWMPSASTQTQSSASTYAPTSSVSYLDPSSSFETVPSSSSTSTPPNLPWDVFISFRGKDTRHNFTSHLYAALHRNGVQTFKDDPALRKGDLISDTLINAIKESKTYIVIFSENYASSSWCLDELVQIYDCYKNTKKLIVGVYYNIEPSVVRHQTGKFKKAFRKHESRAKTSWFNKASTQHRIRSAAKLAKVKIWRQTLEKVADFSGQAVPAHRSEADIVADIVDRILEEINPKSLRVARYPVGLDSRIKDVTTLLRTKGVTKIGIYGMGGVGKTTLAIAVYNQNHQHFEGSCFLENVSEDSVTRNGKVRLQRQLINNVLKRNDTIVDNVEHGVQLIRAKICTKKILIVIDNLDDPDLLQFLEGPFATGSKIIITTRNEDLLDSMKVEPRYKVIELEDAESRQLFNQHAALRDSIISDKLMEFSQEILQHAGGLPLALTVFGDKMVNEKREANWMWFIDTLGRGFDNAVEDSLLMSFNALNLKDPMMQDIFLDIACFFIGREEKEVVKIMETYYKFVDDALGILKKRSLLTINNRSKLGMHHQLSHMGRRIVRKNFPEEPEKHSRLWEWEDICEVLKEQKVMLTDSADSLGTGATSGIIPFQLHCQNTLGRVSFTTEAFSTLNKLKFLYLNNVELTGSFNGIFKDLRWLCWESCPLECLPSGFYPEKLVMLAFPNSKMKTMWEVDVSQDFKELKILNMSDSQDLTTTPEFTKLKSLTTLDFKGCKSLMKVHTSIGSLQRLISLNLRGCMELTSLVDTICDLKALKVLNIGYCQNLRELPTHFGNIESLEELDAEGLTISTLPDSIGRLSKLVVLRLSSNENLETLPDTICNLRSLEYLDISRCTKMVKYTRLMEVNGNGDITKDPTHREPSQIAISENVLTALPSGITRCSNQGNYYVKDCFHLFSSAKLPPNLQWINAHGCTSMN